MFNRSCHGLVPTVWALGLLSSLVALNVFAQTAVAPKSSMASERDQVSQPGEYFIRAGIGGGAGFLLDPRAVFAQGFGLELDIAMGFSVSRHVACGAELVWLTLTDATIQYSSELRQRNATGNFLVLGPTVDIYSDSRRGPHFGGTVGYGFNSVGREEMQVVYAQGIGAVAFVGYRHSSTRDLSIGAIARLLWAHTWQDDDDNTTNRYNGIGITAGFETIFW